ncbi:bifunctional folylpolyglutamate synthase/dihydrofolate synthase [Thiomicrorhabdus immobilis]|uniref:Dihydrofolate synthase/folylpolyglutamate synthase n=1 Tax=Thiomicrorhabdus immobilis TaxID=2791037 RepID=A0ABN6CX64_9GAMM|nr:bifunctional tetrahydrofolate synthase/dihydrofolate synthase [Thiomicrorhabdus immobilis]BCN93728.1 bifunctional folylpolyglutamate synthase/dihydrofolate synthase [Thiomicrorhabdus immobilis]
MNIPNNQSTLEQWVDWLLHLHAQEIDLGLERIRLVAEKMQVTRPAPFVISVAGTNGKGSSVAMLASILKAAGYNVGTYTSPHILKFNERIQVNSVPVSDQQIVDAFTAIESQREQIKLTYFEFSTLAALTIFKQAKLDVVVLEVGLGGRLDAVNVVDADASLITAIDVDHIDWLGDDRSLIAVEKAGIMREGRLSICSDPNPPQTLIDYAAELQVDLACLKIDFDYQKNPLNDQAWSFNFTQDDQPAVTLTKPQLHGDFQLQNASGVVALLSKIRSQLAVDIEHINKGLAEVKHPGRMQSLQINHQAWLIDVAHNPQSAQVLAEYLEKQAFEPHKSIALFSALNDKDMLPMVRVIKPFVSQWAIADLDIPRSTGLQQLTGILLQAGVEKQQICEFESIALATEYVKGCDKSNVLVWGSFFTVAQTLEELEADK